MRLHSAMEKLLRPMGIPLPNATTCPLKPPSWNGQLRMGWTCTFWLWRQIYGQLGRVVSDFWSELSSLRKKDGVKFEIWKDRARMPLVVQCKVRKNTIRLCFLVYHGYRSVIWTLRYPQAIEIRQSTNILWWHKIKWNRHDFQFPSGWQLFNSGANLATKWHLSCTTYFLSLIHYNMCGSLNGNHASRGKGRPMPL